MASSPSSSVPGRERGKSTANRRREILTEHRDALEKLAQELQEKEVLDAQELKEVMDATSPRIVPGTSLGQRLWRQSHADAAESPTPNTDADDAEGNTG